MRFSEWLFANMNEFGGAATTAMHGGIYDGRPGSNTNDTLSVRSKYVTSDGHKQNRKDGSPEEDASKKFGFNDPQDKEETRERRARWIDKKKKATPIRATQVF